MSHIKIQFTFRTHLTHNGKNYDMEPTIRLLNKIEKEGNLRTAASLCNYSYRKAWNILKQTEILFGIQLVEKQRGKGTQLSESGQKILDIFINNSQLFSSSLATASNIANKSLQSVLSLSQPIRIIASDSEKLNQLRQLDKSTEIHFDGSSQALATYADGKCEIAGFHIATGYNNLEQLDLYSDFLDKNNDRFILLEQRQQGLISHPQHPLHSLQQIVDQQLTFVNRQNGSGTRLLLDQLLKDQNINHQQITGYYHEEHTHLAVASMISSRQADAGLGIQSVAKRLNLYFTPMASEYYFLVFKFLTPPIQQVLNLLDKNANQLMNFELFVKTVTNKNSKNSYKVAKKTQNHPGIN